MSGLNYKVFFVGLKNGELHHVVYNFFDLRDYKTVRSKTIELSKDLASQLGYDLIQITQLELHPIDVSAN